MRSLNITIRNAANTRALPDNPSDQQLLQAASALVVSKARILVLLLADNDVNRAIAALYDLGMRRGDVVFLAVEWLGPELFQQIDSLMQMKILELCSGAIQFFPASKVGAIGQTFEAQYQAAYHMESPFYACFYYDAAYLLAYALDYMITRGKDYTQPLALNTALRATRFHGCTGLVTIDTSSNDRSPMMYDIMNARVYTNGSASIVTVGTFNPAGLVLFNFSQDIIWPDNSTTVPTDLRINPLDCPFDASEVVDVPWAAVVMGVLTCVVTGIALGLTLIIWRCAWKSPEMYPMYRAEISFDDYMLFATIGIEALQYSAMAPRRQSWWFFLEISRFASLRIDKFTNLRRGYLWLTLEVLYGILLFWALCIVLMRFRVCKKLVCFERHLKNMSGTVLPFVGDLCFLPICHLLLSILHCTQGVGSAELRTTFLQEDCYQTCWEFSHSLFFAFSVLALWGYVALATAVRPE